MPIPETRPYFEVVEEFLRGIQDYKVTSLCLVALVDDAQTHNFTAKWQSGPFETMTAAGVLQLHASLQYAEVNQPDDEENDEQAD